MIWFVLSGFAVCPFEIKYNVVVSVDSVDFQVCQYPLRIYRWFELDRFDALHMARRKISIGELQAFMAPIDNWCPRKQGITWKTGRKQRTYRQYSSCGLVELLGTYAGKDNGLFNA